MNEKEAIKIIAICQNAYNMEFSKGKFEMWKNFLIENGEYERSLKKANERILSGNQYQPVLAEVVSQEIKATEVQPLNIKERKAPTQAEIDEHKRMQEKIEKEVEEKGIGLNDL